MPRKGGGLAPRGAGCLHSRTCARRRGPGAASSLLRLPQAVSSSPYQGDGRGAAALGLLNVLHRDIHPSLGQRWATTIPLLLEYLDGERECGPLHL